MAFRKGIRRCFLIADLKITQLPEITSPASNDVIPIVNVAGDITSKIQVSNLVPSITYPLSVANGGTGRSTLTSGSILVGAGTSQVSLYTTTGSGTVVALATSPVFTTPTLGVATATSINKVAITAPASSATLTIANGKTLTVSNTITLAAGADSQTFTFPSSTDTVAGLAATQTITNKRITKRVSTISSSATPTINTDNVDVFGITALSTAITSMTSNLTGTPINGDLLWIYITDNGTARGITWGSSFEASGNVALPTTTVLGVRLDVLFAWNTATSKWRCVATA